MRDFKCESFSRVFFLGLIILVTLFYTQAFPRQSKLVVSREELLDNFYEIALTEPLNVSRLHSYVIGELQSSLFTDENRRIFYRKPPSITDASSIPDEKTLKRQSIPLLHYFLNVFVMLQQQKANDKISQLKEVFVACLQMGMGIEISFQDEPPIYYKTLMLKEFSLSHAILINNEKYFIKEIIGRSSKIMKYFKLLYSHLSEVIPMSKLLLHVENIVENVATKQRNEARKEELADVTLDEEDEAQISEPSSFVSSAPFNGTALVLRLLETAKLDKPTLRPVDLLTYSEQYRKIVQKIGTISASDRDDSKALLRLEDVIRSQEELIFSLFSPFLSFIEKSERKWIAIEHFLEIHCSPVLDNENHYQKRTLFHYLTISGYLKIVSSFHSLWKEYEEHSRLSNNTEQSVGLSDFKKRIYQGLQSRDYRGHTPLSYALLRFGEDSEIFKRFYSFLDSFHHSSHRHHHLPYHTHLIPTLSSKGNKSVEINFEINPSTGQLHYSQAELLSDDGGWQTARVLLSPSDNSFRSSKFSDSAVITESINTDYQPSSSGLPSENAVNNSRKGRCDILEIWNEPLPDAGEFFEKYINTATPVIFRNAGLLSNEKMSSLRSTFRKDYFMKRFGRLKVKFLLSCPKMHNFHGRFHPRLFLMEVESFEYFLFPFFFCVLESFGVPPVLTTLREIGNSRNKNIADNSTVFFSELISKHPSLHLNETGDYLVPNYVFLTPPNHWPKRFVEEVPIPKPLILNSPASLPPSSYNLSAIAGSTLQQHGNYVTYSFELQFYLGAAGSGAPVHYHGHAINTLVYGKKV
jgi:hypothetical protein